MPGLASHTTSLLHTDKTNTFFTHIQHFIFKSKIKTKFVRFRPRLAVAVTALGAALEEKVAVGSCLGPKAESGQQAASGLTSSHPLAAHHTRQGVVIGKRSMSTAHQMVPRGALMGR